MLIMYWLSDGEIYHVITGYSSVEEFNPQRAEEFKKIFGFLYVPVINDFVINRYVDFKVDTDVNELVYIGENVPYRIQRK